MPVLILGLVIFLGTHSLRIVADDWRRRQIERFGERSWKALFSVVSLIGLVLIIWGFGQARQQPLLLYVPPLWLDHVNALFVLIAFVLVAAAYAPPNHLKSRLGHPMLTGVKIWAVGHLLATGRVHDVVLFGAFLVWAIVDFAAARRRDRAAGTLYPPGTPAGDATAVVAGVIAWVLFAFWLHGWLIGVQPFA